MTRQPVLTFATKEGDSELIDYALNRLRERLPFGATLTLSNFLRSAALEKARAVLAEVGAAAPTPPSPSP